MNALNFQTAECTNVLMAEGEEQEYSSSVRISEQKKFEFLLAVHMVH